MTNLEYIAALKTLDLTPHSAGKYIGKARRTSYRFAAGTHPVEKTVELLLRMYVRHMEILELND